MSDIKRTRYFDQQLLVVNDFTDEQSYHIDMRRRHNRMSHTPGVAGGLDVSKTGVKEVTVKAGMAIDPQGREAVLDADTKIALSNATAYPPNSSVLITISYEEAQTDPYASDTTQNTRVKETSRVSALNDATGTASGSSAVQLARVTLNAQGDIDQVDLSVRKMSGATAFDPNANLTVHDLEVTGNMNLGGSIKAGGELTVSAGNVGIGTTNPENSEAWDRVLDLLGDKNTKFSVRTKNIDARVMTNDGQFWNAPAGMIIGAKSKHPLSLATNAAPRLTILSDGKVGIGTTAPRTELDLDKGVMSGAANDYLKAQFSLTGGGMISWDWNESSAVGRLKWTKRFIAISMERAQTFSDGYIEIAQPNNIPAADVYSGEATRATQDGVTLKDWESLYAVHQVGGNKSAVSFKIVNYHNQSSSQQPAFSAPSNWILIATVNKDDGTVRLGTGAIVSAKSSIRKGNGVPCGTIVMWYSSVDKIPDGWALCNGQNETPDLRDRFIVAAGNTYNPGDTGGQDSVQLTLDQLPAHNHTATAVAAGAHDHNVALDTGGGGSGSNANMATGGFNQRNEWYTTDTAGDHSHDVTIGNAGGGQSHENRPRYYALCFIMKLFE
ncbi:MAG TPA: hypothetical protein VJ810_36970 [Blastocatellia bacterium]|nr:hypothetical protein [Blastocatellia bacterium]